MFPTNKTNQITALPGGLTGKAEDSGHTSGDVGMMALAVRKDVAAALAATDLDYIPLIVDSTGRLWTAPLQAGEAHAGQVGGNTVAVIKTPVLTVHNAYALNDFIGTSATPIDFDTCARIDAGSGTIIGATLIDYALQSVSMELWLFSATVTPPNDSEAWSISDADCLKCIGVIQFSTYFASTLNSVSNGVLPNGNIPFVCGAGDRSIFGCLVLRGAPAVGYASGDLTVRLAIAQD